MDEKKEICLSSGEVIARGLELIEKHNPEIMERYRESQRKLWAPPSDKPYATAWAVVHKDTSKGLNVVYHSLAHTRADAYTAARRVLDHQPIHSLGYVAKRVRITLE